MEIELRVVQLWTEIKLVITNRFCNHAFDFSPNCTPFSSITIINNILANLLLKSRKTCLMTSADKIPMHLFLASEFLPPCSFCFQTIYFFTYGQLLTTIKWNNLFTIYLQLVEQFIYLLQLVELMRYL